MLQAIADAALNFRSVVLPRANVGGIRLPIDKRISLDLRRIIVNGKYEENELGIVGQTLEKGDRVLECGAGIGFLATYCAKHLGNNSVTTFEANPLMQEVIQQTFDLNGVSPGLIMGAIGPKRGTMPFHVRKNFWASSSHAGRAVGSIKTVDVPVYELHAEIVKFKPTYLFIDIEGGEDYLTGCSNLPGVRKVMAEVHPDLIGNDGVTRFVRWLEQLGFKKDGLSKDRELYFARTI